MGNLLRRILLNSLEAPGIISVRIENVPHEYTAIEGVIEDMTHVILNIKAALLRLLPTEEENISKEIRLISKDVVITEDMLEKAQGSYKVTLQDVFGESPFEMINPHLHLFTVTKPFNRRVDFRVGFGRGYVPSERHEGIEKMTDEIILDTCFSPVTLVNYWVENTRVGQDTDFDRLILDVTTDDG